MAEAYFANLPIVKYRQAYVRNIIMRAAFIRQVMNQHLVFYPHVILEGQTPEMIAHDYYGSCDYDFIVWMSNDIIDPYYEWPLTTDQFDSYIKKKYGNFETAVETIRHYVYKDTVDEGLDPNQHYTPDYQMTPETYSFMTTIEKSYWKPVNAFDYEFDLNESKRTIQLLDNSLVDQVLMELSRIMK